MIIRRAVPADADAVRAVVLGAQAHIANLAVHPDAAGQGLGAALIDRAIAAAQAAGHVSVMLATHRDMEATQGFYRRLGWVETGRDGAKVYHAYRQDRKDQP